VSTEGLPLRERVRLGWLGARGATGALLTYPSPAQRTLLRDLRRALAAGELEVHYQPILEMRSGRAQGAEALVRWNHPQRGFLWPPDFLPQAELSDDLMGDVDMHVLDAALRRRSEWAGRGIAVRVAVNMSGACLDPSFPGQVAERLWAHDVQPGDLALELTERVVMANPDVATEVLNALHEVGVQLCLDDFGTGHSSLARLVSLPFDQIKIDKSFLLGDDQSVLRIVKAITDLCHALGRVVVVEGVETQASWDRLAALGCDLAQGYCVSPPRHPDEIEGLLAELSVPGTDEGRRPAPDSAASRGIVKKPAV